jgi:hypothetical protein
VFLSDGFPQVVADAMAVTFTLRIRHGVGGGGVGDFLDDTVSILVNLLFMLI